MYIVVGFRNPLTTEIVRLFPPIYISFTQNISLLLPPHYIIFGMKYYSNELVFIDDDDYFGLRNMDLSE